jgi:Rrf2 family protein
MMSDTCWINKVRIDLLENREILSINTRRGRNKMQITRQADYALRAMIYLAHLEPAKRAATSQIAEQQHIPPSFLAKIISQLSIAGLIHTSRGARGGVSLARSPEEISVLEVVEAIDGPIALNECTEDPSGCPFGDDCAIRPLWCDAQNELVDRLRRTSFASFTNGHKVAAQVV